jgi:hypothetical protein
MTQSDDTGATNATPKKARRVLYSDAKIIAALKATNGGAYLAASRLGCEPSTIYRRADKNPKVQAVMDTMRGELVDLAEAALKKAVAEREGWAVCFTLKTQGKQRGYVERQEHEVTIRDWRDEARKNGIQNPERILQQAIAAGLERLDDAGGGAGDSEAEGDGDEAAPEE